MRIRCINTGTFVDLALTDMRGGTLVDARFGMEPPTARMKIFDAVAGKRTLVVRLGPRRAGVLYAAITAAAFICAFMKPVAEASRVSSAR